MKKTTYREASHPMDSQSQKSSLPRSKIAQSPNERSYMVKDKVGNLRKLVYKKEGEK